MCTTVQVKKKKESNSYKENIVSMCFVCISEGLNLGKKVSTPKDVMIEELNLTSNRGSRMFQERQKRVDRFTVENAANATALIYVRLKLSYIDFLVNGFGINTQLNCISTLT